MSASIVARLIQEEDGVLSFEWTLLVMLLVVGIVSGVAAARDVILDELGDTMEAIFGFDQSYSYAGVPGVYPASSYVDVAGTYTECDRANGADAAVPFINDMDGGG